MGNWNSIGIAASRHDSAYPACLGTLLCRLWPPACGCDHHIAQRRTPRIEKSWKTDDYLETSSGLVGAALSPLLIGALAVLGLALVTGEPISISMFGEVNFLPPLGLGALALWLLTFGIGEATGWRGYELPPLQKNRSALSASLILAIFWALWHLPQFFYLFDPAIAIGWTLGLLSGTIVFTWLFNSAYGSILIVSIWHGCFNFITASNAGNGILAAVVSTLVMVWAVVVIVWFKPENLSLSPRDTGFFVKDNSGKYIP